MGLFDAVASIWSTNKNNKAAKNAATTEFERTKWLKRNTHQMEVADLRDAGLNPILSANSGGSTGSVATADVMQPNISGIDESMKDWGIMDTLSKKLLEKQIANVEADTDVKNATAGVTKNKQDVTDLAAEGANAIKELFGGKGYGEKSVKDIKNSAKATFNSPSVVKYPNQPRAKIRAVYDKAERELKRSGDPKKFLPIHVLLSGKELKVWGADATISKWSKNPANRKLWSEFKKLHPAGDPIWRK